MDIAPSDASSVPAASVSKVASAALDDAPSAGSSVPQVAVMSGAAAATLILTVYLLVAIQCHAAAAAATIYVKPQQLHLTLHLLMAI